jgi:hypothetical protein
MNGARSFAVQVVDMHFDCGCRPRLRKVRARAASAVAWTGSKWATIRLKSCRRHPLGECQSLNKWSPRNKLQQLSSSQPYWFRVEFIKNSYLRNLCVPTWMLLLRPLNASRPPSNIWVSQTPVVQGPPVETLFHTFDRVSRRIAYSLLWTVSYSEVEFLRMHP